MNIDDVVAFARARHDIWEGYDATDPILQSRKFTNVFRVLDRGSQYLLELMNLYDDPIDRLALSYFYRQVNRPDTMDAIIAANHGVVPNASQIFSSTWYKKVVRPVSTARPGAFLSGAYMILIKAGGTGDTVDKMLEMFPAAKPYLKAVAKADQLAQRVALLQKTPGVGPFLAMQIATDLGYCEGETDQENDFVLAGPGSRKGVKFISDSKAEVVIHSFPVDQLDPLPFSNGRPPSLMDIQNVFCEFSKYARLKDKGYAGNGHTYQTHGKFYTSIPSHFIQ